MNRDTLTPVRAALTLLITSLVKAAYMVDDSCTAVFVVVVFGLAVVHIFLYNYVVQDPWHDSKLTSLVEVGIISQTFTVYGLCVAVIVAVILDAAAMPDATAMFISHLMYEMRWNESEWNDLKRKLTTMDAGHTSDFETLQGQTQTLQEQVNDVKKTPIRDELHEISDKLNEVLTNVTHNTSQSEFDNGMMEDVRSNLISNLEEQKILIVALQQQQQQQLNHRRFVLLFLVVGHLPTLL
jgi:hypothetical protein